MELSHCTYGKARVRVLRIHRRTADHHDIREMTVQLMVEGDIAASYSAADNSQVVATDTMKNTVHYLAAKEPPGAPEEFGQTVARHMLDTYGHLSRITVTLHETPWSRMVIDGEAHPHGFMRGEGGQPFARVVASRDAVSVEGGIRDCVILKSTGSGFVGYPKDRFTTLPETKDRVFATAMNVTWTYDPLPGDFDAARRMALDPMIRLFAETYSQSVQESLYRMAGAAFKAVPEIARMTVAMPNIHYIPLDTGRFGAPADGDVLLPTDEPHGQIEASFERD